MQNEVILRKYKFCDIIIFFFTFSNILQKYYANDTHLLVTIKIALKKYKHKVNAMFTFSINMCLYARNFESGAKK